MRSSPKYGLGVHRSLRNCVYLRKLFSKILSQLPLGPAAGAAYLLHLKYFLVPVCTMDKASRLGNFDVLNMHLALSPYVELRYSHKALVCAKDVSVLQWWKDSGLELKYTERAMDRARTIESRFCNPF